MPTKKVTTEKKKPEDDKPAEEKPKKKAVSSRAPKKEKAGDTAQKPARKKMSRKEEMELEEQKERDRFRPIVTPAQPIVTKPPVVSAPAPVVTPQQPKAPAPTPAAPVAPPVPTAPPPAPVPQKAKEPVFKPKPAPAPAPFKPAPPPTPATVFEKKSPEPPRPPKPKISEPVASVPEPQVATLSERKKIRFNEMMTVNDLAKAMDVKVPDVIRKLLSLGTPASINQRLEADIAALLVDSFGFELEVKSIYQESEKESEDKEADLKPRPPVVTVMGHVDHGKTSLLDAIRSARVVEKEAGGITQHIGAYQVKADKGLITFLDTPGHEAFTAMRARGAMATDLVVLVVAADDSVMPQTIEAIDHARAANVPIVVAINKVDLPAANVQRVKQELAQHNLLAEDWGGKTVMVEVSARTRHNIDKLMEMILLESELLELKANPSRAARGVVLEARLDPKKGILATVLIQAGTLRVGDIVVCGLSYGRVRAMISDTLKPVAEATPSMPVSLLGLSQVPQVGDQLSVVSNDREAREIAEHRKQFVKESAERGTAHISLESIHAQIAAGKIQDLPVILKADVQGSLQAIQDSLGKISGQSIQLRYIHTGIGNINESDVLLAEASNAIIFGFNVKVEGSAETEAKRGGVDIRTYQIIYEMLADIRAAMEGLLKPEEREAVKGRAQVKGTFPSTKLGAVAGCMVTEGKITRGSKARVVRQGQVVATGTISSLRRFKEDVREVEKGYECGLTVEGNKSFEIGDLIETFVIEKHARRLDA